VKVAAAEIGAGPRIGKQAPILQVCANMLPLKARRPHDARARAR